MPPPNLVLIMTDQHRADLCAREGFPLDATPFLDRLAAQGVWFDRAYTPSPICAPARVSLLTGRYPSAHGVRENRACHLARYERDLVDVAGGLGHATAMVGKNHSHAGPRRWDHYVEFGHGGGRGEGRSPEEVAFDERLTALNHGVALEPTPFPVECQGPYRAVSESVRWLRSLGGRPFLLWLSFAEPHNPYQVPEPYFGLFPPETLPPVRAGAEALAAKGFKWEFTRCLGEHVYPDYEARLPRMRSNYLGMLRLIDDQVRRMVDFLDAEGLRENTLIVFLSDHGDFVGEYGLMRKGPEMPDVLQRVPLIFAGPGIAGRAGPNAAHVSLVDVMPTLCEALGAPIPPGVQGRSLWPLLTGDEYPPEEFASVYSEQGYGGLHYTAQDDLDFEHCLIGGPSGPTFDELNSYSQSGTMRAVRKGRWRLILDMQGRGQLHDLEADPAELTNLYGRPDAADVQRAMLAELAMWCLRAHDPLPLPVGKYVPKLHPRGYWTG